MKVEKLIKILEKIKNKDQEIYLHRFDAWMEKDHYTEIQEIRKQGGKLIIY